MVNPIKLKYSLITVKLIPECKESINILSSNLSGKIVYNATTQMNMVNVDLSGNGIRYFLTKAINPLFNFEKAN